LLSQFFGGVAKEYITKLGFEKYMRRVTYRAPLEMLSGGWQDLPPIMG
jgi:hypothetical protein